MVAFVRNSSMKMTLILFQPISVVMIMVPMLLRQFRRLLQIRKIITNAPCVLQFAEQPSINNSEKRLVTRTPPTQLKKLQKLHRKKSNNWHMVSFIHNESEITTSKAKAQNPKQHFQDRSIFFNLKQQPPDHQISTKTLELYANSLKQLFLKLHLQKNIQQFILPMSVSSSIF